MDAELYCRSSSERLEGLVSAQHTNRHAESVTQSLPDWFTFTSRNIFTSRQTDGSWMTH